MDVKKLLATPVIRYIIAGGAAFTAELLLLYYLVNIAHLNTALAVTIGFWTGLIISFLLQKFFAFGDKNTKPLHFGKQGAHYGVLVFVNYMFTLGFVHVLESHIELMIARTIALIITTTWNFFVYKKIIFNTASSNPQKKNIFGRVNLYQILIGLVALIGVVYTTSLVSSGLHSRPIADDLAYFSRVKKIGEPLGSAIDHYYTHNGRAVQAFSVYALYYLFGEGSTRIAPALIFTMLLITIAILIAVLLPIGVKNRLIISSAFGLSISSALITVMPRMYDSFLWLTSSTVYIPSLAGTITALILAVLLIKQPRYFGIKKIILLAPLLVALQLFGEGGAATSIVIIALTILWLALHKKYSSIKPAAMILLPLILGFLINYLSPATRSRQSSLNKEPFDIAKFGSDTFNSITVMLGYIEWWHIVIMIGVGIALAFVYRLRSTSKKRLINIALINLALLLLPIVTLLINSYVAGDWLPVRNLTVPYSLMMIWVIQLSYVSSSIVATTMRKSIEPLLGALAATLLIVGAGAGYMKLFYYNQFMVIRDVYVTKRNLSIERQMSNGSSTIETFSLPIALKNNAAEDIFLLPTEKDWILRSFIHYHNIKKAEPGIVPPEYCLNSVEFIQERYLCENKSTLIDDTRTHSHN